MYMDMYGYVLNLFVIIQIKYTFVSSTETYM